MSNKKVATKEEKKDSFWWIYNQEEVPVAVAYAKTSGGALSYFESATGLSRLSFRAEQISFHNKCGLTSMVQ